MRAIRYVASGEGDRALRLRLPKIVIIVVTCARCADQRDDLAFVYVEVDAFRLDLAIKGLDARIVSSGFGATERWRLAR